MDPFHICSIKTFLNDWKEIEANSGYSLYDQKSLIEGMRAAQSSQSFSQSQTPMQLDIDLNPELEELEKFFKTHDSETLSEADAPPLLALLKSLLASPDTKLQQILEQTFGSSVSSDEALAFFITQLLKFDLSFSQSMIMFSSVFVPRVSSLTEHASRTLDQTLKTVGKRWPVAMVDSFLVPVITQGTTFGAPQGEVVNSLLSDCINSRESHSKLLQATTSVSYSWTEHTILFFQHLLDQKPILAESTVAGLISGLQRNGGNFVKNAKFSTFIFHLTNKHPTLVVPHYFVLKQVLENTESFMTRRALAKLEEVHSDSTS